MRYPTLACAASLLMAATSMSAEAGTMSGVPTRRAFDAVPKAAVQGCFDNARMASHAAYRPGSTVDAIHCGRPLSTDTLMAVHHWDRT